MCIQFLAQGADRDFEHLWPDVEIIPPYTLEKNQVGKRALKLSIRLGEGGKQKETGDQKRGAKLWPVESSAREQREKRF